jgi:hypothetical protein
MLIRFGLKFLLYVAIFFVIYACSITEESKLSAEKNRIFTNVTNKAGLSYIKDSYSQCWGDVNNDGFPDILVINHAMSPMLLMNHGDGTFIRPTNPFSHRKDTSIDLHGCAIGDYDNDGDQDIYITVGAQQGKGAGLNRLYQNNGNGSFIDVALEANVTDPKGRGRTASWLDYNNDGLLDLFVTNARREDAPSVLFENNGNGSFSDVSVESGLDIDGSTMEASWNDYDNDGFMDLTILSGKKHRKFEINIYNNFKGTFKKIKTFYGQTYAWGDYDNDGDLDLFISIPPLVRLWSFEFSGLSILFEGYSKLYENVGEAKFIDVSNKAGFKKAKGGNQPIFFDYDNDGDLDIYLLVNGTKNKNINDMIFENNGDKTFTDVTSEIISFQNFIGGGCCIAYGDYNNDGFLDLFLTNGNKKYIWIAPGSYVLYKNRGNDNNWLKVKLVGTKSNKDGNGAGISIYVDNHLQYRQNNGNIAGYIQNSNIIHFGLGDATSVDKLEVAWPSGFVSNITNIKSNQLILIEE